MLKPSDTEERAAKCNICSCELSVIEIILYGNRCVFCFEGKRLDVSSLSLIQYCYWDHKIYQQILRMINKKGPGDAHLLLLGAISEMGQVDMSGVKSVEQKKKLFKILRGLK